MVQKMLMNSKLTNHHRRFPMNASKIGQIGLVVLFKLNQCLCENLKPAVSIIRYMHIFSESVKMCISV